MSAGMRPALAGLWLLALLLMARGAGAHGFEPALLDLREREAGLFDVVWKAPASPDDGPWMSPVFPGECTRIGAPSDSAFRLDCGPSALRGSRLSVRGLDGRNADVLVRVELSGGRISTGVLRSDSDAVQIPSPDAPTSSWGVLRQHVGLGVRHIFGGIDHLLFVLGLLLIATRTRLLLATLTAFTIAHGLTFALSVTRVVQAPPAPVEALIALSILLLAVELGRPRGAPPTWTARAPWAVAFAFGLVHGLGFAGALAGLDLLADRAPLALLGFNLGVEAGQLAFVALMLAPRALLSRWILPRWPGARRAPAYAMGAISVAWTLERVGAFWQVPS